MLLAGTVSCALASWVAPGHWQPFDRGLDLFDRKLSEDDGPWRV
jgi:hypothetical protein